MSFIPRDVQVILPRVAEIYHTKPKVVYREDIENSNASNILHKDTKNKQQSVNQSNESAKSSLMLKEHEKNKHHKRGNHKQSDEGEKFIAIDKDGNKIELKHLDLEI